MFIQKNIYIEGCDGLPILIDIFHNEHHGKKPVIIYAHGFNGFKDWGNADLIAHRMADAGFVFIKFNFSHNGTSKEDPESFTNLDAFGKNNYSKELADVQLVIDWAVSGENTFAHHIAQDQLGLIGHSRGGGIAIITAAEDKRIQRLATWASVSECKTPWTNWTPEKMKEWKALGVAYYRNSRTGQDMPLYYQLWEDYQLHQGRLNIRNAIRKLTIPVLICHGTADTSVPISHAHDLSRCQPTASLFIVDADHVFGRKHPWLADQLPEVMQLVLNETIHFFSPLLSL